MAGTRASAPPLRVELAARPRLVPAAGMLCGLVILALLVLDVPGGVRVALLACAAVLAVAVRRVAAGLASPARLEWTAAGEWRAGGEACVLRPETVVLAGLVVLALRGTRTRRYWIARGDLDPVTFRRLKMRLRHVPGLHGAAPVA